MTKNWSGKLYFNVGPYPGLISYLTRREAAEAREVSETTVAVNLNQAQQKVITSALKKAFSTLG